MKESYWDDYGNVLRGEVLLSRVARCLLQFGPLIGENWRRVRLILQLRVTCKVDS